MSKFIDDLRKKWDEGKFVCVGLDSEFNKIPGHIRGEMNLFEISNRFPTDRAQELITNTLFDFNRSIIDATYGIVCAYKPNDSFYAKLGDAGTSALRKTIAQASLRGVPVIWDAKFGDIGSSNEGYATEAFRLNNADTVTVNPYLGDEAYGPFLDYVDKGIIFLVHTSNPGSKSIQDQKLANGKFVYEHVAELVKKWNYNGNCCAVVGATFPEQMRGIRKILGDDIPILIPGVGAQGGDVEAAIKNGIDSRGTGIIINSSRGIIFASGGEDFAEAAAREAKNLNDQINLYRGN